MPGSAWTSWACPLTRTRIVLSIIVPPRKTTRPGSRDAAQILPERVRVPARRNRRSMARIPAIDLEALNAADRKIYDAIAGPRGGMGGPFAAWFVVPEIAGHVNALVDRLRYASKL